MEFKRAIPYRITIDPTINGGFIVEVGCVKVAYASPEALIKDLAEYLKNPVEVEKEYKKSIKSLSQVQVGPMPTGIGLNQQWGAPYPGAALRQEEENANQPV